MVSDKFNIIAETSPSMTFSDCEDGVSGHFKHTTPIQDNPKQHNQHISIMTTSSETIMGVTTCVTTRCLSDGIDSKEKMGTTWTATQVCLRTVKSGLGGHEVCLFGVDKGVTNPSPLILKRGRMAMSKCPTFSDIGGVWNDIVNENRNDKKDFHL